MTAKLPEKKFVASFDVDAQNTFTPVCPNELAIDEGHLIVDELNKQANFASIRIASRDAHSPNALWIATEEKPPLTPIHNEPNLDIHWPSHAIIGTKGFDFIDGLDPNNYDFQVYKGIEPNMHPYGACYHDLHNKLSTGAIEYLRQNNISTIIVGGLATDYCVKNTVLQLLNAGFDVFLNLAACRGVAADTTETAIAEMQAHGAKIVADSSEFSQ